MIIRYIARKYALAVIITSIILCPMSFASESCKWQRGHVSSEARPLPPAVFDSITAQMNIKEIARRLGPAARDIGSGLYIIEWEVTDGRTFRVSATSACAAPMKIGFSRAKE